MAKDKPRDYLGRGFETIPGKSFGYAHNMERIAICEHITKRPATNADLSKHQFRITSIQERIHKYKPTFKERQKIWLAKQPKSSGQNLYLTDEERDWLIEKLQGTNHPLGQSILAKIET